MKKQAVYEAGWFEFFKNIDAIKWDTLAREF